VKGKGRKNIPEKKSEDSTDDISTLYSSYEEVVPIERIQYLLRSTKKKDVLLDGGYGRWSRYGYLGGQARPGRKSFISQAMHQADREVLSSKKITIH
jgi:hypothetical protein